MHAVKVQGIVKQSSFLRLEAGINYIFIIRAIMEGWLKTVSSICRDSIPSFIDVTTTSCRCTNFSWRDFPTG